MSELQSVRRTYAQDMWQHLASAQKPIVLYGMGNGADKILAVFAQKGIEAADFFASDGFVRGQSFHGKTVLSYAQVCEKYEDFIIAVSFGSRLPEVMAQIDRLDAERELVMPDVPVAGEELFDGGFFDSRLGELEAALELFEDDISRRTFLDVIAYRLSGRLCHLRGHTVTPEDVYRTVLGADSIGMALDLGAYNGDSIRDLASFAPSLARVMAMEPDARTFKKLEAFAGTVPYTVEPLNAAAWDREEILTFTAGGNRNSTAVSTVGLMTGAKLKEVQAARPDAVCEACDFIKYDVEGAEARALDGSRGLIERCHPKLLVSLYHRSEDIFRLPLAVRDMGYTKLYLRRYPYYPAWDLNLLAVE